MADNTAISTVYNHFLTTYAPQGTNSKYDTHKKSELRGLYNSIVKMNKEAPLFLLDTSPATQEFAVGLKESARSLKNVISSLSMDDSDNMLDQKAVASSDPVTVEASFIGGADMDPDSIPSIEISVEELAGAQENRGKFLDPDSMGLDPGTYSFDIHSRDMDYEFQFNIGENDTNKIIEEKLARLITRSNIGVNASVLTDDDGRVALSIKSDETGVRGKSDTNFDISDNNTHKTAGTVEYFGIGDVTVYPKNSRFTLNGEERSTFSNHFSIEKIYDINLKGISPEGEAVSIGLKTDVESVTENINNLVNGYNSFINNINSYSESQPYSRKLVNEMNKVAGLYSSELESIGLKFSESGTISVDNNLLTQTAREDDAMNRFSSIRKFTESVLGRANKVALDPMEYTQKTVVAYKNPGHGFATPYVTSNYSGMMFSSYC
ncbi:MAG: flagellar filament capping protein FliD [Lachnospiraceae bacterium]|nr:flagellar filament capping protein FliD [Lachnospiraceae bacterium]